MVKIQIQQLLQSPIIRVHSLAVTKRQQDRLAQTTCKSLIPGQIKTKTEVQLRLITTRLSHQGGTALATEAIKLETQHYALSQKIEEAYLEIRKRFLRKQLLT